jgi:multidrug transporter EmrE-like cation transporter
MKIKKTKKISPLVLLFVGGIILTIGDIAATEWIRFGGKYMYFLVFTFYLLGMIFLMNSYKSEDIPVASLIMVIFNVVILFFVGVFMFGEEASLIKIIGIFLCFVSIFLLEFGKWKGR